MPKNTFRDNGRLKGTFKDTDRSKNALKNTYILQNTFAFTINLYLSKLVFLIKKLISGVNIRFFQNMKPLLTFHCQTQKL